MNNTQSINKLKYEKDFVQGLSDKLKDTNNSTNLCDEVFSNLLAHLKD